MKRDLDLCRRILEVVESLPARFQPSEFEIPNADEELVYYNVKLLREAGLVEALDLSHSQAFCWVPTSLTWDGHDFLAAARKPKLWEAAKKRVADAGAAMTLEALKIGLKQASKEALGVGG